MGGQRIRHRSSCTSAAGPGALAMRSRTGVPRGGVVWGAAELGVVLHPHPLIIWRESHLHDVDPIWGGSGRIQSQRSARRTGLAAGAHAAPPATCGRTGPGTRRAAGAESGSVSVLRRTTRRRWSGASAPGRAVSPPRRTAGACARSTSVRPVPLTRGGHYSSPFRPATTSAAPCRAVHWSTIDRSA